MTAASAGADLQTLLELLGGDPGERITIGFLPTGDDKPRFKATRAGHVDAVAGSLRDLDCSYSAQPLGYVNGGRGDARDVTGIRELYADLDAKPDGMPTSNAACAVITDLSSMLGAAPVAVVSTGHGLQPHWRSNAMAYAGHASGLPGPLPAQLAHCR